MWQTYKGDGSKGPFTFTFGASNVNQIVCIVSTGYGDMTLNGADFSVTLNNDQDNNPGGIVTLDQVLPVGHYLTVGLVGQIVQTPNSVERRKGAKSDVVSRHLKSIEDQYRESVFKTEKIYTDCADKLDDFTESEKKVITDKLDEVNADIDAMKTDSESRLSTLETSIKNTENYINSELDTSKANVDKKILTLTQAIEQNDKNIQTNKANIASNLEKINDNSALIASNTSKLSNHETRITKNTDDIASLEPRVTTNENDITAHGTRLDTAESDIDALETLTTQHTEQISSLKTLTGEDTVRISSLENRVGNIETSTDVGQFATRLRAIDEKNAEQDTAIADEVKARTDADSVLETKNTEQDTRLDAIETKNTEQDTALTNAKTELSKAIADNKTATDESISNLTTSLANDYVTLGTEQTITKQKTFTAYEPIVFKNQMDNTQVPTADIHNQVAIRDKNNNLSGMFQVTQSTTGFNIARLSAVQQNTNGNNIYAQLQVGIDKDNNTYTYAPTPKITSNDTNIANTAWVRQLTENTEQTITAQKVFKRHCLKVYDDEAYDENSNKCSNIVYSSTSVHPILGWTQLINKSSGDAYLDIGVRREDNQSILSWFHVYILANGTIGVNTNATIYAPNFQSTSDRRLKSDFENVHIDLSSLDTFRYTFQPDGKKHIGLIAQDVQKIIPEAVSENPEHYLTLDYNAITACLVAEVNALKKRVAKLEEKIK